MTGKDRLRSALRARTVALLAAAVVALTACTTAATTATSTPSPASSSPAAAVLATSSSGTSYDPSSEPIVQVVERVTPAVVTVRARSCDLERRRAQPLHGHARRLLDGEVIGINAAGSSQAENIGFAVAIDAAKSLIQKTLTT